MRTERVAAACGAVSVVLVMVGNGLATAGQSNVESGRAVLADLQHRSTVQSVGFAMEVVSFAALLVFLGFLYGALRRAERPEGWAAAAAFGVGLVATAVKLGSAAPALAAFLRRDELSPELARTLDDINGGAFVVSGYVWGIFVALAAGSAFGSLALPRWLSISGLVVGALTIAAGVAGTLAPAGYVPIPFLLCQVWILVASVLLTVRGSFPRTKDRADDAVPAEVSAAA